jgi:hypothetical protein
VKTRGLIALEDEYRAYREVLAAGVKPMRPGAQVATTLPALIEEEAVRFDPQVIICCSSGTADPGNVTTWIGLFTDPSLPAVVRLGGRRFEQSNPTLDALLAIVDETGRLAEANKGGRGRRIDRGRCRSHHRLTRGLRQTSTNAVFAALGAYSRFATGGGGRRSGRSRCLRAAVTGGQRPRGGAA